MSLPPGEVFEQFDIEFDAGEEPVFHGGELVTGSLKVTLKQKVTIKAIRIQFKGRACWLGDSAKGAEVEKVYFDRDFVLLERPPGRTEPGHFPWAANFTYRLPFQCPLPKGCPTSYESPQAFIRYFARATFITDEIDPTQYIVKKGFTIIAPPELHQLLPPLSDPVEIEEVTSFGSCCCRGKVVASLKLPKTAYAPGERVIGSFSVNNKHPKQIVDQIEVRLVDTVARVDEPVTVNADGTPAQTPKKGGKPTIDHRTLVLRKLDKDDVIKAKSQLTLENVNFLTIPPVPPTTIQPEPSDVQTPELNLEPNIAASQLLESPSTLTFKQRKEAFLNISYILQVSIGNRVLIEVPINVHPIPLYEHGVEFRPYIGGLQNFHEVDEADKKPVYSPFRFEPRYPVYVSNPAPDVTITCDETHQMTVTPHGDVELNRTTEFSELPNGDQVIVRKEEIVIVHNENASPSSSPPPEKATVEQPGDEATSQEAPVQVAETDGQRSPSVQSEHKQDHEHEHHNGHVKQVTEYTDGDNKTQKTVESYEYTDENGVRVEVQKTTESTIVHHENSLPAAEEVH